MGSDYGGACMSGMTSRGSKDSSWRRGSGAPRAADGPATEEAELTLASEEVSKCLVAMKEILYGTNEKDPQTETVAQLAQELYNSGLLLSLVNDLQVIDFEASEEVSKCLVAMKEILYGTNEKDPQTETVAQLAQELYNSGLLLSLVNDLQVIDFEGGGGSPLISACQSWQ
ncbi:UNVERIFIED_CONTAM: hypothetical protein FKN15_043952 [Acipenser sinensis]